MPKLSVWLVRASLVCMGIGFLFGAVLLFHKGIPIYDGAWRLLNPHIELMLFGWMMQFVIGIAFWILPRFSVEPRYGRTDIGWWGFGTFNIGVLLAALGTWFANNDLSFVGHVTMLTAVVLFISVLWPRVKPLSPYAPPHTQPLKTQEISHDTN